MKHFIVLLALLALLVMPASAVYSMMDDIDHVNLIGGSCSGAENGSSIANSYDGDETTWLQATNCGLAPYFTHNWTVDYCHYRYDGIGTATKHWELYWSGYTASPNSTTLTKDAGYGAISPKNDSTTYNPLVVTGQYLAGNPGDTSRWYISEWECFGTSTEVPPPQVIANFTGAPLEATAPAYVAFTDTSENEYGTCEYNWTFDPTDGVLVAPQDLDNEDITMLFTENGNFTISHGVSCGEAGSNISTKTDYIHIVNATELSTFRVRAVDALSGYGVNGAEVDVYDIENSSWTNQTSVTGEVTVTAITGHTINAYGSATGYDDGESLALPVVDGSLYPIYMWPSSFATNVSEGNVTLYVTVLEDGTNTRLSGMSLSLSAGTGGADYTIGQTNDNGIFQTTIKNQTNYLATVPKQNGYLGAAKSFNSGTQSGGDAYVEVTIWLQKDYVTTAPTVTTLPDGSTPTPTVTYLANCDPSASDYDAAKCRSSKGGVGLNLLADNLESLILLCIVVTMFYLLGIRLGR